ncbi:M66 family metalloprotease [Comamonas sp.]|uniref:M66 family metalloprotease n=1 Tax=Comamonas sp. TaxID=34028 RepID=UPI003A9051E9
MQKLYKAALLGTLITFLAGCGGGEDGGNSVSKPPTDNGQPSIPIAPPAGGGSEGGNNGDAGGGGNGGSDVQPPVVVQPYPEPLGGKYAMLKALGFYDHDKTGQDRAVRNDLVGSLPAMVQFAQSHTVDPSGNTARHMPTLTSEREALLLVTPDPSLQDVNGLTVTVSVNGLSMGTLQLRHPNEIFRSDYANQDGRPDYVYSRRAWSAVLPWDWVKPGLELRVSDAKNRSGTLTANAIEFAAPADLVVHSIELGMLTDAPSSSDDHWFLNQPAKAATDYFQTVPLAKLTAAYYERVRLSKVMVASGSIYETASAVTGGTYDGDMRENTAKATFSTGINLANFGVTSSGMQSQQQPQVFQSAVAHHARGLYANGVQGHGLSGGNGILTLYATRGNEFSHEIGHHYGLGHYPGEQNGNRFWSGHHHDSGWGYIGYRKRMRANLHWTRAKDAGLEGMPVFENTYSFASDAMSGGHYESALSLYTHYTGYSTQMKIQPSLDKPVLTPGSATGYTKWNASSRSMQAFAPAVPTNQSTVWYNSASGLFLAPRLQGVPVITLLGGYDPETDKALIYPAARSNWGNVFELPQQAVSKTEARQCWLDVSFAGRTNQRIAVAGRRMETGLVNKLHVNLAQSEQPTGAQLYCQTGAASPSLLYTLPIAQNLPAMAPPVVVGKGAGYTAIRKVELPELEKGLLALEGKKVLALSSADQLLYDSYAEYARELGAGAYQQFERYTEQKQNAQRLNRWLAAYADQLDQPSAQLALLALIQKLGLDSQPLIPAAQSMLMPNGNCIQKVGANVQVAGKSLCRGDANEQWILDGRGSIRSRADLGMCLTDQGGNSAIKLQACDITKDSQVWDTSVAKRIARGNHCMDLNTGHLTNNVGTLITYGCNGGSNQQWSGLIAGDSMVISLLDSDKVRYLEALANTRH